MLKHRINKMYNIQEESETLKVYKLEGFVVELNSDDIICRLSPGNIGSKSTIISVTFSSENLTHGRIS